MKLILFLSQYNNVERIISIGGYFNSNIYINYLNVENKRDFISHTLIQATKFKNKQKRSFHLVRLLKTSYSILQHVQ